MPKKKSAPKKKSSLTLAQVVEAAHAVGATVSVSLVPRTPAEPERALLKIPPNEWPGDPTCRSVLADMQITHKKVEREFRDNPSSKWVITPYEIIERQEFFRMLEAKKNEVLCVKCGIPSAFPKATDPKVTGKPYVCLQCQDAPSHTVVATGSTSVTTTYKT